MPAFVPHMLTCIILWLFFIFSVTFSKHIKIPKAKIPLMLLLIATVTVTNIYLVIATLLLNLCGNHKSTCSFSVQSVEILNSKEIFPYVTQLGTAVLGGQAQTELMVKPVICLH